MSDGPYTGRDVENMLIKRGYESRVEPPPGLHTRVYIPPDTLSDLEPIPVNRQWEFDIGDPIFRALYENMGLTRNELRRLLGGH